MTIGQEPICLTCKHYRLYDPDKFSCKAFPEGIPDKIVFGEISHRENVPGDNGLKYVKGEPQEFDEN